MNLKTVFREHWPIDRLYIRCNKCGKQLHEGTEFPIDRPSYASALVKVNARLHAQKTGHTDLDVGIDNTIVKDEIDVSVTISDDV